MKTNITDHLSKIIVTIGPATQSREKIKALVLSGANIFRLNTSHGDIGDHQKTMDIIKSLEKELGIFIPTLIDLQGPKIRVDRLHAPISVQAGEVIDLYSGEYSGHSKKSVPIDFADFFLGLKKDSLIYIDDGNIQLEVLDVVDKIVTVKVLNDAQIKERKGLNVPDISEDIEIISDRDKKFVEFAQKNNATYLALSFVRTAEEIVKLKKMMSGYEIFVIAKIEKPQALKNIEAIMDISDGIMVARGDLAIEANPQSIAITQKKLIEMANRKLKPVIVATQMLESMISKPFPTRAEITDVSNAVLDGTDCLMLSGETAVGQYPEKTVEMMKNIINTMEKNDIYQTTHTYNPLKYEEKTVNQDMLISSTINSLDIDYIIAITENGYTARLLSKSKINCPIIAVSNIKEVCSRLMVYRGLFTFYREGTPMYSEECIDELLKILKEHKKIKNGDKVIVVGGLPYFTKSKTTVIRFCDVT